MSTTPTPAALRVATAIREEARMLSEEFTSDAAKIIDREGMREAVDALRQLVKAGNIQEDHLGDGEIHPDAFRLLCEAERKARAALARLEGK